MNLQQAAQAGNLEELAKLLDAGANIDAADHNGMTALIEAIYGKHLDAAKLLVERGASYTQKTLAGIDARRAAADLMPELVPVLIAHGAVPWAPLQVDWISTEGMGNYTRALIETFRGTNPLDEDPRVMELWDPAMPADLRALLQAFAHTHASAYLDLGEFEIQKRSLCRGPTLGQLDEAHAIVVGAVYGGPELVVSWSPDAPTATWVIADHDEQDIEILGSFEDVIEHAREWAEEHERDPAGGLVKLQERAGD